MGTRKRKNWYGKYKLTVYFIRNKLKLQTPSSYSMLNFYNMYKLQITLIYLLFVLLYWLLMYLLFGHFYFWNSIYVIIYVHIKLIPLLHCWHIIRDPSIQLLWKRHTYFIGKECLYSKNFLPYFFSRFF